MAVKRAIYDVASFKALPESDGDKGHFQALVSVFGNVDVVGDRVLPGAFAKSLTRWQERGDPIPIIWSHEWGNPQAHIGAADPNDVVETEDGLVVKGRLDLDNPFAAQVFRLLKERRVREFSFGYSIEAERPGKDGANELVDLDLIEAGPTLKGANPNTELLAVKSDLEAAAAIPTGTFSHPGDDDHAVVQAAIQRMTDGEGGPLLFDSGDWNVSGNTFTDNKGEGILLGGKAGRRISRATESELSALADEAESFVSRIRGLLSAGDSEKQDDDEQDAVKAQGEEDASGNSTADALERNSDSDFELLMMKTRIERMRD